METFTFQATLTKIRTEDFRSSSEEEALKRAEEFFENLSDSAFFDKDMEIDLVCSTEAT